MPVKKRVAFTLDQLHKGCSHYLESTENVMSLLRENIENNYATEYSVYLFGLSGRIVFCLFVLCCLGASLLLKRLDAENKTHLPEVFDCVAGF